MKLLTRFSGGETRKQRDLRLDREFLAPAQQILSSPASPLWRNIAWAICALFVVALLVMWFGHVDIYAVAPGRVQPLGRSKVIQPLDPGKVIAIHVSNGSAVHVGQVLIELDRTERTATAAAASDQGSALAAEIARRKLEIGAARAHRFTAPTLPADGLSPEYRSREQVVLEGDLAELGATVGGLEAQMAENATKRHAAEMQVAALRTVIGTLSDRAIMRTRLLSQGWESRANVMDANEQLQREQASLSEAQGQIIEADAARRTLASQIREAIAKFVSDGSQALSTAQAKLDQTRQDIVKASSAVQHMRLTSPLEGTVQELDVTTLGQVVSSGQQLMVVVPRKGQLEIEALVPNKDIGFVRAGQPAVIKFDAFPFTRYGTVSGTVVRVSRDAVSNGEAAQNAGASSQPISATASGAAPEPKTQDLVFPVTIRMDRNAIDVDGKPMPLTPGLSATIEIKTGNRRVLEYILSPLVEVTSQAGHER